MVSGELDILNIMLESGIVVKLVLLILIVASVLSWAIVFKKKKIIKEITINNSEFLDAYNSSSEIRDVSLRTEMMAFSPYKVIFDSANKELSDLQEKSDFVQNNFENIERALKQGVNDANKVLEKDLSNLASIGAITPFIGLFGTVWGIINSFSGLAGGGGTLDAVAPGIAEALVATAVGLAAAIPAVWFYNYFSNINAEINNDMDSFGQKFLNMAQRLVVSEKA